MIPYWQLMDAIRTLDFHDYLFVRALCKDEVYILRIEKGKRYDGYDEHHFYHVRMTKRTLPVAYLHEFAYDELGNGKIQGFLKQFHNYELLALEDSRKLPETLKNMV